MYLLKTMYIFTVFTIWDSVGILQYIIKMFYLNRKHTFSVIPRAIGKGRDGGHIWLQNIIQNPAGRTTFCWYNTSAGRCILLVGAYKYYTKYGYVIHYYNIWRYENILLLHVQNDNMCVQASKLLLHLYYDVYTYSSFNGT